MAKSIKKETGNLFKDDKDNNLLPKEFIDSLIKDFETVLKTKNNINGFKKIKSGTNKLNSDDYNILCSPFKESYKKIYIDDKVNFLFNSFYCGMVSTLINLKKIKK